MMTAENEARWTEQISRMTREGLNYSALRLIRAALDELENEDKDECGSEEFYAFLSVAQRQANTAIRERDRAKE